MDAEILQDYLTEAKELLQKAQEDILSLEADPETRIRWPLSSAPFTPSRAVRASWKPATWWIGLTIWKISSTKLRSYQLPVTSARIDAILKGADVINLMFQELEDGRLPGLGPEDLGRTIQALAGLNAEPAESPAVIATAITNTGTASAAGVDEPPAPGEAGPAVEPAASPPGSPPRSAPRSETAGSALRVDANRLDAVMYRVGELVLLRNRLTAAVNAPGKHPSVQIPRGSVIIYADDSSAARRQIETVLNRLQLPFVGAKTGKEAWDHLRVLAQEARSAGMPVRQKVAMVLTDLEMPEMDGFTLTRRMKEDDALKSVPIVIHSSLSGSANESHANRVGAGGYVAKFVPNDLIRTIVKALDTQAP